MVVENVSAILKDIKVTKKGINITFEDVRLRGEQLQEMASLIGEVIMLGVDVPQMGLFDDEDVNELDSPEEAEQAELFEGESVEGVDADNVDNGESENEVYAPVPLMGEDEALAELGLE